MIIYTYDAENNGVGADSWAVFVSTRVSVDGKYVSSRRHFPAPSNEGSVGLLKTPVDAFLCSAFTDLPIDLEGNALGLAPPASLPAQSQPISHKRLVSGYLV